MHCKLRYAMWNALRSAVFILLSVFFLSSCASHILTNISRLRWFWVLPNEFLFRFCFYFAWVRKKGRITSQWIHEAFYKCFKLFKILVTLIMFVLRTTIHDDEGFFFFLLCVRHTISARPNSARKNAMYMKFTISWQLLAIYRYEFWWHAWNETIDLPSMVIPYVEDD